MKKNEKHKKQTNLDDNDYKLILNRNEFLLENIINEISRLRNPLTKNPTHYLNEII